MAKLEDLEANQMEIIKRLVELKDLQTNPDGSPKESIGNQPFKKALTENEKDYKTMVESRNYWRERTHTTEGMLAKIQDVMDNELGDSWRIGRIEEILKGDKHD